MAGDGLTHSDQPETSPLGRPEGTRSIRVGVLALQGAFAKHVSMLQECGVDAVEVKMPRQLAGLDGLIIPGGESSTISKLLDLNHLRQPLAEVLEGGLPVFGTCAGMILLAKEVLDGRPDQSSFGALDITVRRNGYGRQLDSFEADLEISGLDAPFRAVFIRAPKVEMVGESVEVLARVNDSPVLVRSGSILASAFHPELTDDVRLHQLFLALLQ